jgi:hypothetical protein
MIRAELDSARTEFHSMLDSLSPGDWERPSANPAWTNGQLLFHILFGFLLVPRLWRIMALFGRLPTGWSRRFAALLDASTPVFNRVYGPKALARSYDRAHSTVARRMLSIPESTWIRGMYYPTRWEPGFSEFMTFADLPRYAIVHQRHHRGQLRPTRGNTVTHLSQ